MVGQAANPRIREALERLERETLRGPGPADDYGIEIARDGTWTYRGSPIRRAGLLKLFASVLHRTNDGRYWLVTPVERTVVRVEDVPFTGVELAVTGAGRDQELSIRTNLDHWVRIDARHPLRMGRQPDGGEAPYIGCRDGLEARLSRPVFYELVELAEPEPGAAALAEAGPRLGVWSAGRWFALEAAVAAPGGDVP